MYGELHIAIFKFDLDVMPYFWLYRVEERYGWRLYDTSGESVDLGFLEGAKLISTAPVVCLGDVQDMLARANATSFDESGLAERIPF